MSTVEQVRDTGGKPSPARGDEEFERVMNGPRQPGADPRPEDGDAGLDPPPVVPSGTVPPGHDDAGEEGPPPPVSNGVPAGDGAPATTAPAPASTSPAPADAEEAAREALVDEVADALLTGDPAEVQRLVARDGRDAFAVASVLDDAEERVWDSVGDDDASFARAERAQEALDAVRLGRGPVSFALALEQTLRDVGALAPGERLASTAEAQRVLATVPEENVYAVRDAVARAEVASGMLAQEDMGLAFEAPDPGLGPIDDLRRLAGPGAYTYGWQIANNRLFTGSLLVIAPTDAEGANGMFDFTDTDGDARNRILLSVKRADTPGPDLGRWFPGEKRTGARFLVIEPESSRLGPFLRGEAPLFGENGLIPHVEVGGGYVQPSFLPDLPAGIDKAISGPTLVGQIRAGVDTEDGQRVYNVTFAVTLGPDTLVSLGGAGVAGATIMVPGGQKVAAGAAGVAMRAQAAGRAWRETAGVPVAGAAWSLEVRFDRDGFDGVYHKGERIGLLSDGVQASLEAEARARGITVEELVESGQAEDAIMRGLGGMTR